MECGLEPLGQHCTRILPVQCYIKDTKPTFNSSFSWEMLSGASWIILYLCNVVPLVLRQHSTEIFSSAVLSQVSCTRILLVQCCLESIKTTLNSLFSSAMLSRVSRATLQCCPKDIKPTLSRNFSCAMLSRVFWSTLHKNFTTAKLSQ